jgi:prolyl-tRNA synthetase
MLQKRGIEVGHVFKLGTKYSDAIDARFLNDKGQTEVMVMGCYGIGVTRTLQAVIEQNHDADGIRWPMTVAPYPVTILLLDPKDSNVAAVVEKLAEDLESLGVEALIDDRDERPGVKFKDADLIGFPLRVVVGAKSLARGGIEIKLRTAKESELVPADAAARQIATMIADGIAACKPK